MCIPLRTYFCLSGIITRIRQFCTICTKCRPSPGVQAGILYNLSHVEQLISCNSFAYISADEIYRITQRYRFPLAGLYGTLQRYFFPLDGSYHRIEVTHELFDVCKLDTVLVGSVIPAIIFIAYRRYPYPTKHGVGCLS